MKLGTNQISKVYMGSSEVNKVYLGTNLVFQKSVPEYNVGNAGFLMRFDGSWDYYSDGTFTASLVNAPSLATGGPFNEGSLAPTYDPNAADQSVRKYVNVAVDEWTKDGVTFPPLMIEWWTNMNNAYNDSLYSTFVGNMTRPGSGTYYYGFTVRWTPSSSYLCLDWLVGNTITGNNTGLSRIASNAALKTILQNPPFNTWAHYAIYFGSTSYFLMNGNCYQNPTSNLNIDTNLKQSKAAAWPTDILIGNANYSENGHCASNISEVRILRGQNAEDYLTAIKGSQTASNPTTYSYTIPTGPFGAGTLTKYTAQ